MEYSGHDVAALRLCRLDGCGNELGSDDPKRGRWANICQPCRQGLSGPGRAFRLSQGLSGVAGGARQVAATGSGIAGGGAPIASPPPPIVPVPAPAPGVLEQKARAILPLARELEKKARASSAARAACTGSINDFSTALVELRDAAKALLQD